MNNLDKAKELYKDKKVLILGLGINQGGLGATKFFVKAGSHIRVTDIKSAEELKTSLDKLREFPQIEYTLGEHKFEDIDWADLIIKNPALKPGNKYIEYAKQQGKQVEMDMGIFLQFVSPKQVIGVTGTKGKSTTASLIYEILKGTEQNVIFAGNIGKSVLDTIDVVDNNSLIVLELSSFQLEAWGQHHISPHFAVITNIFPDHLNYYGSMDEYIKAKRFIAQNQTAEDYLFLRVSDPVTSRPEFLDGLHSHITYFSPNDLPSDFSPILPGEHNRTNMAAALAVALSNGVDHSQALGAMQNFPGVEFRMQLIKKWLGPSGNFPDPVKIYNDTTATNPGAATESLKSLPNAIVIVGGQNAGLPYEEFAKTIDSTAKAAYFLEGDATNQIKELLHQKEKIVGEYNDLGKLVSDLKQNVQSGDIILFSPGAKSFNLFQNEFDRGRKFNEVVDKIFI